MQIDRLRSFVVLAETGSFNAAAREVYLSQQGLSKAIASLENELGVELFHRSNRGVELTAAGRATLEYARVIINKHDEMLDAIIAADREENPSTNRIRAYLTHYASSALHYLEHDSLHRRIQLSECSFDEMLKHIDAPEDDRLFICGLWGERKAKLIKRRDIRFVPYLYTQIGVLVSASSPLAERETLDLQDVTQLPKAVPTNKDLRNSYIWVFGNVKLRSIQLFDDNAEALVEFARSGDDRVAFFDSFRHHLLVQASFPHIEDVRFVHLSTIRGEIMVGAITKRGSKPSALPARTVTRLARWIERNYPQFSHPNAAGNFWE